MEFRHIQGIVELLSDVSYNRLSSPFCGHSNLTLSSEPFCDPTPLADIYNERTKTTYFDHCPSRQLMWLLPNGEPLFHLNFPHERVIVEEIDIYDTHAFWDHHQTVFYVLKKYYKLRIENSNSVHPSFTLFDYLYYFFGETAHNLELQDIFKSDFVELDWEEEGYPIFKLPMDLSFELIGKFRGEYPVDDNRFRRIAKVKNGKINLFKSSHSSFLSRFLDTTGIVRLRTKDIIMQENPEPEETGFNIEAWQNLTLNQSQFLRDFIRVNKLVQRQNLFIDDQTKYKQLESSLGLIEYQGPNYNFGHANKILTRKF